MRTILLLICSNIFMTFAWYGHLKHPAAPLLVVILLSWLIALPEYICQVPANRWGHRREVEVRTDDGMEKRVVGLFTGPQLKIIQEVISITVFLVFSFIYLKEAPRWNEWLAFALVLAAVLAMTGPSLFGNGKATIYEPGAVATSESQAT